MTTEFDPELGILRIRHGALSILGRLAVAPTDPTLTDHATAPPLAELRAAGLLGAGGIHPDVRPLAEVVGAPTAVLDLDLQEGAGPWRRCRAWATPSLLVVAVPATTADEAYDLAADHPAQAGALLTELVGLTSAPPAPADPIELPAGELDAVLAGGAAGPLPAGPGRARWRLAVRSMGDRPARAADVLDAPDVRDVPDVLDVLDDGESLWRIVAQGERVRLEPTDAVSLRAAVSARVRAALG